MPQLQFPFFPAGSTHISTLLAFSKEDNRITYYAGGIPIFFHDEDDLMSFRMITAQFCVNGQSKQADIARAFGVAAITVKRAVKCYREFGPRGFYAAKKTRGPAVLTVEVMSTAQQLLSEGLKPNEVADRLEIPRDTLRKAVRAGRLHVPKTRSTETEIHMSTKSKRSAEDSVAPMGVGATNVVGRLAASVGQLGAAAPKFQPALDVACGGVLTALPAMLAVGLLDEHESYLKLPAGYYGLDSLLLLLVFMVLARIRLIESLRYESPGEWGKIIGLDRAPEARTLREKVDLLADDGKAMGWSAALSQRWLTNAPEAAGTLYVDGHVRVYHGHQTALPRHYVARQKLCLRASVDYWVNAMDGQPFFVVNQAVDPGMIKVIEGEILERVLQDVPHQPSDVELVSDPLLHRLTLVFDREGYSPDFFRRVKKKRVACLTYHKFPGPDWPSDEFRPHTVKLASGQTIEMYLAERGTRLSNGLWVREIRRLSERAHQTSILSTDYRSGIGPLAIAMFSRWSQENFYRYAREHFDLDRLIGYGTTEITDPILVVNPDYRRLDSEVRSANGKLSRMMAEFGALSFDEPLDPKKMEVFIQKKASLQEAITAQQATVSTLKAERKKTPHHIKIQELPEAERFHQLNPHGKQFIDTIKVIGYRAETAMANTLREHMSHPDEARTLLEALYRSHADLLPDYTQQTLTVCLHHTARPNADVAIKQLCEELNATETTFPRTSLRLVFQLGPPQNLRDQVI